MGTREQNQSTLNEIVFENRNKNYGAYVIRREYDLSLIKSFVIASLFIAALIASFQLMPKPKIVIEKTDLVKFIETPYVIHPKIKEMPKAATPHTNPPPNAQHGSAPVVVDHDTKRDSVKPDENTNPNPSLPGTGTTANILTEPDPGPSLPEVKAPETFETAEVNPEFPGGEKKLLEYLRTHIRYPREAISREISGTVMMRFVVGTEGEIRQIEFMKKIGCGCEAEAQRVVESMPRWKPGTMKGKPVQVYFYLPVNYRLQ
jgi:protein TonB